MDNRSDYPAKPRNLGCELFRVFSQPERNGFATGTLISPSQARRNSSRAWRVGRTEDSPDEREGGRRSALRGNGRPKGQPFSASSIPARPRSEYRVASRPPFGVTWSAYYPRWRRRRLDLLVSWRVSLPDFAPQTQLLPAVTLRRAASWRGDGARHDGAAPLAPADRSARRDRHRIA